MAKAGRNSPTALEIGDEAIRLAVAEPCETGKAIRCYAAALPRGAVEWGEVVDPDVVVATLRALLGKLPARPRQAVLVLGGKGTVCRVQRLADAQDRRVVQACEERMRRYVVFGGEPILSAWSLRAGAQEGAPAWLVAVAARRDLVLRQVDVAKRAGLRVVRAEPTMVSVAAALLETGAPPATRFVLMAHRDGCEVGVLREDGLTFCQELQVGSQSLVRDAERLVATLEQVLDYHLRHAQGQGLIEELLCFGGPEEFDGLFDRLGEVGMRAGWVDPGRFAGVARLEGDGVGAPSERAAAAAVVAAARGDRRAEALDLLPQPEQRRGARLLRACVVVPVALTLLVTCGLAVAGSLARRESSRLTYLLNHPSPEMVECSRLLAREDELKQRNEDVRWLLGSVPRYAAAEFLAELPRLMLKDLWLERLSLGPGSRGLVEGMAQAEDVVFAFADALRGSPHVEAARISRSGGERVEGLLLSRFSIEVTLAPADGPASGGDSHE